jgi:phosphoserine phosphatase RsbU/P
MNRRNISANFDAFLRLQAMCVGIILAVWAIFWAMERSADVTTIALYVLIQVNLTALILKPLKFLYGDRKGAYRWVLHAVFTLVITAAVVFVATIVVYLVDGERSNFANYLRGAWRFPFVANVVFSFGYETYKLMKCRLERRNRQLQETIDVETAEREVETQELQQAREIQRGLMPKEIPQVPGFEIAGSWEPAQVVGGDYFDVIRLSATKVGICIADVVGKGISAALLMANVQAAVRAFASDTASPSEVCSRINSVLCTNIAPGKFVTLFYGVLDTRRATLTYADAGHLHPLVIGQNGAVARLQESGALLGVFPDWQYKDARAQLVSGDTLVLFTDGITEAASEDGTEFGEDGLIEAVLSQPLRKAGELQSQLLAGVRSFCNSRMADDATLVVITSHNTGERDEEAVAQQQVVFSGAHDD